MATQKSRAVKTVKPSRSPKVLNAPKAAPLLDDNRVFKGGMPVTLGMRLVSVSKK